MTADAEPGVVRRSTGALRLLTRLGWRDMRTHTLGPLLLGATVAVAAAALTLTFQVGPAAKAPWDATWWATGSPHVIVVGGSRADVDGVLSDPAIIDVAGPFPLVFEELRVGSHVLDVQIVGRDAAPTSVDQPAITAGTWVRSQGVVLEGSLADALDLEVGDSVPIGDRELAVVGIAASGAQKPIAFAEPGLLWATYEDVGAMIADGATPFTAASAHLTDPNLAAGFAAERDNPVYDEWPPGPRDPYLNVTGWEEIRYDSLTDVNFARAGLITGAIALALLTLASAAIYLTGRLETQTRRMGLLKAVGATPGLAARFALAEQLAVTLVAGGAGLVVGCVAAPGLARPEGAYLLEGTHLRAPGIVTVGVVFAAILGTTALPALRPARRAARASTIRTLTSPARPPRRAPRLIALSARLPVPALLGVRLASRRPGRALLSAMGMGVSVAMIFVALAMEQGIAGDAARQDSDDFGVSIAYDKLRLVVYVFTIALIVLAAINALPIAWSTAADAAVPTAVARSLGATPRQVGAGLALAQSIPAALAAAVGVPFGLLIYLAARATGGDDAAAGPGPFLVVAIPAVLVLTVALTLVPSQLAARQPVVDALRSND